MKYTLLDNYPNVVFYLLDTDSIMPKFNTKTQSENTDAYGKKVGSTNFWGLGRVFLFVFAFCCTMSNCDSGVFVYSVEK